MLTLWGAVASEASVTAFGRVPHSASPQARCEGVPYERPADFAWILRETPKADESSITKVR